MFVLALSHLYSSKGVASGTLCAKHARSCHEASAAKFDLHTNASQHNQDCVGRGPIKIVLIVACRLH